MSPRDKQTKELMSQAFDSLNLEDILLTAYVKCLETKRHFHKELINLVMSKYAVEGLATKEELAKILIAEGLVMLCSEMDQKAEVSVLDMN